MSGTDHFTVVRLVTWPMNDREASVDVLGRLPFARKFRLEWTFRIFPVWRLARPESPGTALRERYIGP